MLKKIGIILPLSIILFLFIGLENNEVEAYSPHDVPNAIKNGNYTGSNKANRSLGADSGKKLVYDVYSGNTTQSLKHGWRIENKNFGKGSQPYLTFTGWSAMHGHRHHYQNNQETYIQLENDKTFEIKTYRAQQTNLNASKDLEYNRLSDPNRIYNPCSASRRDVRGNVCNMYYEHVGFKAFIPLNEIFPEGTKKEDWSIYIIKKVGTKVLWDELRVPFQFSDIKYGDGNVSLSSGINASRLQMNTSGVIRRHAPRGTGSGSRYGYFTHGDVYRRVAQNEQNTAIWYGVHSPRDRETRWAVSSYWTFGGTIANLSYEMGKKKCPDGSSVFISEDCKADVTIKHVNAYTGGVLSTDTQKATVGQKYSFSPKPDGTFKDSRNRPFIRSPQNQTKSGTTPNNNFTITFYYKVSLPDPSYIDQYPDTTSGQAKGEFEWKLDKGSNVNLLAGSDWKKGRGDNTFNNGDFIIRDNSLDMYSDKNYAMMARKTIRLKANTPYRLSYESMSDDGAVYFYEKGTSNQAISSQWAIGDGKVFEISGSDRDIDIAFYKRQNTPHIKYWNMQLVELDSLESNETSMAKVINNPEVTGSHYAIKDVSYEVKADGLLNETSSQPITVVYSNPNSIKNKELEFNFSYDYTNHYKAEYTCTDKQGSHCFKWQFLQYTPVWDSYTRTAEWSQKLKADHEYGETIATDTLISPSKSYVIGQRATLDGANITVNTKKETFNFGMGTINLLTQNWMGINETIQYESDLKNGLFIIPNNLYYFPNDIDKNLSSTYRNNTTYSFSDYAIPLDEMHFNHSLSFETKDNFYLTKKEGFLFSVPKEITNATQIRNHAKDQYESYYGINFEDEVLTKYEDGSRYYFTVDGNSEEKPNEWYQHVYVIGDIGLSDIEVHIKKDIKFDKYLVGHAQDDTVIGEEFYTVDYSMEYPHSVTIPADKHLEIAQINNNENLIHSYRVMSFNEIYNQLKNLLPSLE